MNRPPVLSLDDACALLRKGGIVAYPTETFYGIGCSALDSMAVACVCEAKGRPDGKALPVLVGEREQLEQVVTVEDWARPLMDAFWPGPLSLLLPAVRGVPMLLTGATGRVAVRQTPHPVARALCLGAGVPLAASSANMSGQPPVTRVADLDPRLLQGVDGVVDLPPEPDGGMPSTLIEEAGRGTLRILRPGAVTAEMLRRQGYRVVE